VSTGRTFPTGVGAPILLEGLQVIGRVRPLLGHPQVSSIARELQDILTDLDKLTSAGLLGARIIQLSTANQQLRIELG
jgi:hypothetical protein